METKPEKTSAQNHAAEPEEDKLVRSVDAETVPADNAMKKIIIIVYILLIALGVGTGYLLSKKSAVPIGSSSGVSVTTSGKVVGSSDSSTFKDTAQGTLEKGGAPDGEGTHKLIRDGGPSQTVYLISSVVDLDQYAGKKVKIWGQTQAAKNVAWLMDVGKVEVSE